MDRSRIAHIAQTPEDAVLLAKLWDRINTGMQRNVPVSTAFLSLREQALARSLFGTQAGLTAFGGYDGAERRVLAYLPDYLDAGELMGEDSPLVCLRAAFYAGDAPSHRDFLGALMGAGVARETVGDICVAEKRCDFFVTRSVAPFLLQNLQSAGRAKLTLTQIPLADAQIPKPETRAVRDTVASLRLDSVIAAGFRIGRSSAADYIAAGRAAIDGMPCEKTDKPVAEGASVTVRGLGKLRLAAVTGTTRKGRIGILIERYV